MLQICVGKEFHNLTTLTENAVWPKVLFLYCDTKSPLADALVLPALPLWARHTLREGGARLWIIPAVFLSNTLKMCL